MVTIVFDHPAEDFPDLKIAGEFTDWEGVPMKINTDSGKWEYEFDESSTTKHNDKDKVHFKFIDQNGNWFADDEYPKEIDEHSNENNVATLSNNEDGGSANEERRESDKAAHEANKDESELYYEGPATPTPSLKSSMKFASSKAANLQNGPASTEEAIRKEVKHEHAPLSEAPLGGNSKEANKEPSPTFSQQQEEKKKDEGLDNLSEGNDNTRVNEDTDITDSQESEHEINGSDTENTDISEQEEIQKRDKPVDQSAKSLVKEGDTNTEDYESVLEKLLGALGRFFGSWFSWLTTKMSGTETA
ncbi:Uip4p [Saccharomyces paradoxus]|uniref:Uip4p n=1 Tax=Saccharomyces paradoxus TaxID=27291 RepID=A0A8B8V0U0_SACPA|nr:Uip4 [Saccharomyces paradoxus]QHS76554.1 Uip4 [Saccharomyces paradoxus]